MRTPRIRKSFRKSPALSPRIRSPDTGHYLPGNKAAQKHGLLPFQHRGELPPDVYDAVTAFQQQIVADQGGESECSAIRMGLIRRLTRVEAVCVLLEADIARRGPVRDPKTGRVRETLNMYLNAVDRYNKLAERLGLERKPKKIGKKLEDYIDMP